MGDGTLTEQNSWRVLFYEDKNEFYEGYLFRSKDDAVKAALEYCKSMSPKRRSKLIKVNADKLILSARDSCEYVVIMPPEKFKKMRKPP